MTHRKIRVELNCYVVGAEAPGDHHYRLQLISDEATSQASHPLVINCLWGDRRRLDEQLGIFPARPMLLRYKLGVQFDKLPVAARLPSLTLISGPYGDIVNHGDGGYFLSWYPVCRLAETVHADPAPLYAAAQQAARDQVIDQTFAALVRFAPELAKLSPHRRRARVSGGIIAGWGRTDIDDPGSELHQRHDIGFADHRGWISFDTGKYCTATLLAQQLCEYLAAEKGL